MVKQLITSERNIPPAKAGASGYFTLSINMGNATILSIRPHTQHPSSLNGLQLTPIYISSTEIIVEYYAPNAIVATTDLNWVINYID